VSLLAEHGAECRSIAVEDGLARLEVEAPQGGNARRLVEVVTERYPETTLAAYREAERAEQTRPEFAAMLREQLTDRQYTALQRAHAADFFEWPRPVSGGELAESMDISRPTFHQHLRAALRKLVTAFFDGGGHDREER
jgi:predicted DNA binding protein